MSHTHDDHHGGLQHDLETLQRRMQERRRILGWLTAGSTVALVSACGGGGGGSSDASSTSTTTASSSTATSSSSSSTTSTTSGTSTDGSTCLVDPSETNGPYPADGSNTLSGSVVNVLALSGIVRSDITSSFGDSSTEAEGVPMTLTITLVNVNASCAPLEGYAIYLWQCDQDGNYSLYSSGIQDENYLRGVQETDSNGQLTFTTIFPACYTGRWPHLHFEIYPSLATATSYTNRILTSQIAMPEDICNNVYNNVSGYSASIRTFSQVSLSSDNVFGDNSDEEIAWQTPSLSGDTSNGYTATISIGVAV